ncbi:MAG TPA: alkaline ceramidase [Enterococcus sp.]|nr:alkaline ceramidase [Enterococcus sp.]
MKVGSGRIDITPTEPFYLLGYKTPLRNEPAEGIHDHVFINGLLICNNLNQKIFIATGDLLEIEDKLAAEIRLKISLKYNILFDHVIIGVTHDHHSVRDFHENWTFGKFSQKYQDILIQSFIDLFETCHQQLTEASALYGEDKVQGFYSNRNHPGQESDNVVSVIKFVSQGKAIAGIVNLAVHSTVLSGENMLLTADLAGNLSKKLNEKWDFYPLMLIGCAGDSSNHHDRLGRDFSELDRVTTGLADKIGVIRAKTQVNMDNHNLRVLTMNQEIINDKESYDKDLIERIKGMRSGAIQPVGSQPVNHLIKKCEEQLKETQFYDVVPMRIIDLGDLRIFVFPGELASAGGDLLRNSTPKTVLIAGYCDGFHHYFLEKKDYGLSFETIGNPVPPGTFEHIIQKFCEGSYLLDYHV